MTSSRARCSRCSGSSSCGSSSHYLLVNWLEWYGKYYGGLGIVMALFFWVTIPATILILAAALSPALARRRELRRERAGAG